MPTGNKQPDLLVDTSVAIALVVGDHEYHRATVRAIGNRRLSLCGHLPLAGPLRSSPNC